jgi:predicted tellurium resistance membrane protein TerC
MEWLIGLGWFSLVVVILALIGAVSVLRWLANALSRDLDHLEFLDYDEET